MKIILMFFSFALLLTPLYTFSQQPPNINIPKPQNEDVQATKLTEINDNLSNINSSVKVLAESLNSFFQTFNSNQGLRLSEKQQKILMAFEVINHAEQRLTNLNKLKIDLSEAQTHNRLQLARITDDLLPESIDRYVSIRGSINAERLREIRRDTLTKEKNEITKLLFDINNNLNNTDNEICQTEIFIRTIRERLFSQIENELSDF